MLDQIFVQMFASQWIVFIGLVILLLGLCESAWRMGLASSRKKSEADKEAQFSERFATLRKRTADLQDRLWGEAVAAAAERPSPITASFISSLNETIDLEGKRIAAKRNHVPGAVWLLLLCVAVAACAWSVTRQELPGVSRFLSGSSFQFSSRSSWR